MYDVNLGEDDSIVFGLFKKKKSEVDANEKKRLPIFDEWSNLIHPWDIPLGLPMFKEYSKYPKEKCEELLKEAKRMKRRHLNEYEREYLTDFIKSLETIIYIRSHPDEIKNIEFYYI